MDDDEPLRLLRRIYGGTLDLHLDLHDLSEDHRARHGGSCDVYPSDPANAPIWPLLTAMIGARRFLEVGCGLGYTAALMAEAGGVGCHVDTIEGDEGHANLAEEELSRVGLSSRIKVLKGRAKVILPRLRKRYDLIFLDADWSEYPALLPHLVRLTRPGGVLVSANLFPLFADWARDMPHKEAVEEYLMRLAHDRRFATYIVPQQWHALSYRLRGPSGTVRIRSRGRTSASTTGRSPRSAP